MPEGDQCRPFFGAMRNIFGEQRQALQAEGVSDPGGNVLLRGRVVAFEQDEGDFRFCLIFRVHRSNHRARRRSVVGSLQWQGAGRAQQVGEAAVEFVDAAEEMQYPLVDAQAAGGEAGAVIDFDQAPAAQRALRREGAPVRVVEGAERQAETDGRAVVLALGLGAEAGQFAVHFEAGTKQQQVALEGGKSKGAAQPVDGAFAAQGVPGFGDGG